MAMRARAGAEEAGCRLLAGSMHYSRGVAAGCLHVRRPPLPEPMQFSMCWAACLSAAPLIGCCGQCVRPGTLSGGGKL